VSGLICALVEGLPQRRGDPRGDFGPFGVPRSGSQTRNSAFGGPLRGSDRSFPPQGGTPNESVRNEANFQAETGAGADGRGRRQSRRWDRRYKQSQLADTNRDGRRPAKARAEPAPGPSAPNEPNWPDLGRKERCPAQTASAADPGDERVKQSQFPARAGMGEDRQGRPDPPRWGQNVRNKANPRQSDKKSKYLAEKELWHKWHTTGLDKTKPIA
jgi:hypothetical protein